jgi:outer membrane lipoprotein-sorting protein
MSKRIVLFWILFFLCSSFPIAFAQDQPPDVQKIIDKVDKLFRSNSSAGVMEMTVATPHWERTMKMNIWSEGMDKTFISIVSPKKDAGIATLRIENEMWNYFPNIDKVMKVPPSMMMGSWMGSDFTNDDLVKESSMTRDYHGSLITPEGAKPEYHYLQLVPKKSTPSVWGRIVLTVRKKDLIPVREQYFDEKGREMRTMELSAIREFDGKRIPSVLEMVPLNKKGHKTVIRYIDMNFTRPLGSNVFTLRNLQKRR